MNRPIFDHTLFGFASFNFDAAAPGAGASWTVPDHYIVQILSFKINLVTSAAAGDRFIRAAFSTGSMTAYIFEDSIPVTASHDQDINGVPGAFPVHPLTTLSSVIIPLPIEVFMRSNNHIDITCRGILAADQFDFGNIACKTWFYP